MAAPVTPTILSLTTTDDIDAAEVFRGTLPECKAHVATLGQSLFARRAEDGRILLHVHADGSVARLWDSRAYEGKTLIERQIRLAPCRLVARAFDKGVSDLELLSDKDFHHVAQQRAVKKAGLKISKFGGNVEVSASVRAALVTALRAEGFTVVDYNGREIV